MLLVALRAVAEHAAHISQIGRRRYSKTRGGPSLREPVRFPAVLRRSVFCAGGPRDSGHPAGRGRARNVDAGRGFRRARAAVSAWLPDQGTPATVTVTPRPRSCDRQGPARRGPPSRSAATYSTSPLMPAGRAAAGSASGFPAGLQVLLTGGSGVPAFRALRVKAPSGNPGR